MRVRDFRRSLYIVASLLVSALPRTDAQEVGSAVATENAATLVAKTRKMAASHNYRALLDNDDASVSIIDPKFNVSGTSHWIDFSISNDDGVCRLFGFDSAVLLGSETHPSNEPRVAIGPDASFLRFMRHPSARYDSIMCRTGRVAPPSTRYARLIKNDDGSTTVAEPSFRASGKTRWIDYSISSDDGVCRLFGFESAVLLGAKTHLSIQPRVAIGPDASFLRFMRHPGARYDSIICR